MERRSRPLLAEVAVVWAGTVAAVVVADRNPLGSPVLRALPLVPALWIYVPLLVLWLRGRPFEPYGYRLGDVRGGLHDAALVLALLLPTYAVGHLAFRLGLQGNAFVPPRLHDVGHLALVNLVAVALPEELFFRGYVQRRLEDALGSDRPLWGGRLGPAVVLSALLFNAAHPLAGQSWWQGNLPFGILLGWMRARRESVLGPALVHAFTNVAFVLLERCVR